MRHQRLAAIILHHPAQPIRFEIRLRIRFFAEALDSNHCLRRVRLLQRFGGDQTFAVDRAAGELESKPLRHIAHARFDLTGRGDARVVDVRLERHALRSAVVSMADGVGGCVPVRKRSARVRHAERIENVRAHEFIPRHLRRRSYDFAGESEHDVLVLVRAAE